MIGSTEDHQALATSLQDWARSLHGPELARSGVSHQAWADVVKHGVAVIGTPEGGDGELLDVAVALEACARELLPGPLLGTAIAATLLRSHPSVGEIVAGAACGIGLGGLSVGERLAGTTVVYDAGELMLLGAGSRWFVVPASSVEIVPGDGLDLSRRAATVTVDLPVADLVEAGVTEEEVRRTAVTLAAAEASGIAAWCLATAVDYAKVREQFGQPIGRFQAIKHLCASMLETSEAVSAAAWDAASATGEQAGFAADVAGVIALDGGVKVAQDCIQVLGGIGFTFEHDAHLYLRRAVALRSWLGAGDVHAASLARRARAGERRRVEVPLDGLATDERERVRATVERIATASDRRAALVEAGYLTPHWPAPYGIGATPVQQLVIDEELAAAGVERPDLKIGGWAAPTILAHGTDAQRERFVAPTLRGEIVWCQLFSEPGAGSDLASLSTRAVRAEGGWRLTGQKVWTSLAAEADWAICLARTNPDVAKHQGITYFLVDMRSEGLDVRPLREMTGDALFNEVFLDDVFVPDELVVGEVDGGWRLARTTLANERVAMASARLGTSVERAIELATDADLVRVGRAVALATVCSLLGARTVLRTLAGRGPGAESSVAKLLGVRNRQDASELAVDLLGSRVLVESGEEVHEMLLTRCLSIAGGTTQVVRNVAAEQILGLPR